MKIRTKIFAATMLVVLFLLGSLTYTMTLYSTTIIKKKIEEEVGFSVSQLSQNIDQLFQSYEQVIDTLYTNTNLQSSLLTRYDTYLQAHEEYFNYIHPYLSWVRASKDIKRITMFTDNPTLQFGDVKAIDDEIRQLDWYPSMENDERELVKLWLPGASDPVFNRGSFRLAQKIHNELFQTDLYTVVELDERLLYNLVSKGSKERRYLVILPDGRLLLDSFNRNKTNLHINDYDFHGLIQQAESASVTVNSDGKQYLMTVKTLDSRQSLNGFKAIALTPIAELYAKVDEMKRIALALLIGSCIISALLMYMISSKLTKRLIRLAGKMMSVNLNDIQIPIAVVGHDEISQLARVFHKMTLRMQLLIKEVYNSELNRKELELRTKETELYALQMQVNPHYLFNTLNALYGNLLEKKDRENAEIVTLLAQSFRNVLGKTGMLISLSEEFEMVEIYLKIQEFRFGSRLRYEFHIQDQLLFQQIPRLSLQILVENAIVHALEKNENDTIISIEAELISEDWYTLQVRDNGPGMNEVDLQRVRQRILTSHDSADHLDSKHIGLRNIQQRLTELFEAPGELSVESKMGEGTIVTMKLPIILESTEVQS